MGPEGRDIDRNWAQFTFAFYLSSVSQFIPYDLCPCCSIDECKYILEQAL